MVYSNIFVCYFVFSHSPLMEPFRRNFKLCMEHSSLTLQNQNVPLWTPRFMSAIYSMDVSMTTRPSLMLLWLLRIMLKITTTVKRWQGSFAIICVCEYQEHEDSSLGFLHWEGACFYDWYRCKGNDLKPIVFCDISFEQIWCVYKSGGQLCFHCMPKKSCVVCSGLHPQL